jgi:arsenate reductase (thioredoxin)
MNPNPIVVFVCEHGAAKSVLAAAYFDKIVGELELDYRAIARGTNPDPEVSPQTIAGLADDGLTPTVFTPQKLTGSDIKSARRVVSFCDLPEEFQQSSVVEYWKDIPPVSENYERARDVIVDRLRQLLESLG